MTIAAAALVVAAVASTVAYRHRVAQADALGVRSASEVRARVPATPLKASELFDPGATLEVSAKARALDGKRVRIVGFMAQMELPPKGGFFLSPRPVHCDEAGGGTADLPPESVMVIANSARNREVPFMEGALEMTGVFDVGNRADSDGRVSAFRLILDGPLDTELPVDAGALSNANTTRKDG